MDQSEVRHLTELDDASRLLLRAADIIESHGWCQNSYTSAGGKLCLLGAVKVARGLTPEDAEDTEALVERACERVYVSLGLRRVHIWNDEPGRTKEEVIAKLRSVALGG